jgi:hypothetical protein
LGNVVATHVTSGDTLHTDAGFAGFEDVFHVHLTATGGGFAIDNLTIDGDFGLVPEPVSAALLGIGLLGMAAGRRRRK